MRARPSAGREGLNPAFLASARRAASGDQLPAVAQQVRRAHSDGVLNLASRGLKAVPPEVYDLTLNSGEKFWECVPTSKLDLSFNDIARIPSEVGLLADLLSFKCRHNQLAELPDDFYLGCTLLRHLDLSQNRLAQISALMGSLVHLRELLLFENNLSRLPESLSALVQLQVLDVSGNRLESFPDCDALGGLTFLNISQNQMTSLPACISGFVSLEVLECGKNRLKTIPSLRALCKLKRFDAMENKLTEVPILPPTSGALTFCNLGGNSLSSTLSLDCFAGQKSSLSELHLAGNALERLDLNIFQLSSLKVLDVSNNSLDDLPYTLGYMPSLHRITAVGNRIRSIRQTLISNQTAQSTESLKEFLRTRGPSPFEVEVETATISPRFGSAPAGPGKSSGPKSQQQGSAMDFRIRETHQMCLDLSNLSIASLNDCRLVEKLLASPHVLDTSGLSIGLLDLNLGGNALEVVPEELGTDFTSLKVLNLSGNKLGRGGVYHRLPGSLISLNVSKNGLSAHQLGQIFQSSILPKLQHLDASSNALESIPMGVHDLAELREINLSFNRIAAISNVNFARLLRLEVLNLASNKIDDISSLSGASATLHTLMCDNNEIRLVPSFLGSTRFSFQSLTLAGNPQRSIPISKITQGTAAIIAILRLRES